MIVTILAFIFVFGVLVFVHELGHFLGARIFKVRVDEFAFGFPPRIWSKKQGDTEYSINAIPIGGYVKLLGEIEEDTEGLSKSELTKLKKEIKNPANLQNKKPWQRAVIFASGVAMNFLLAWVLLVLFYVVGGKPILPTMHNSKYVENTQKVYVQEVTKDTPAAVSGLLEGDEILEIDGKRVSTSNEVFSAVQGGKEVDGLRSVTLLLSREGKQLEKKISTYKEVVDEAGQKVEVHRVGIEMEERGKIKTKFYMAPIVAAEQIYEITKLNIVGIYQFFKEIFVNFKLSKDVGGPIAIAQISGAAARMGFATLIQVMAVLSIAIGILNILPFPALDGGHILFLGIEKVIGRNVAPRLKNLVNYAGFGLLLLLMISVTAADLNRLGIFSFLKGLFS